MTFQFRGAKGGAAQSSPTRVADNLRADDTVELLVAISEGRIKGLENQVDGRKSFFFNDTVVVNADGTENFTGTVIDVFKGDAVAEVVKLALGGVTNSSNVNVPLAQNVAVTRTGITPGVDKLEIRVVINQLFLTNNSGDELENTVVFRIEYKATSSPTWTTLPGNAGLDQSITGKTTSNFPRDIRWSVPVLPTGTYDIRLTKISPDSTTTNFSAITWESIQEVSTTPRSFDDTALARVLARASDQFSSLPTMSGIWLGIECKVPTIYNPATRVYNFSGGPWDGTFQIAWTDNPAWILYDYVMNTRYGMNAFFPVSLNKFDVLDVGIWCDASNPVTGAFVGVPNGSGGVEPRYTFSDLIAEPRDGREQANFIAGTFNGKLIDGLNGSLSLKVDKDDPAVHLFTKENVVDGEFKYSYTDLTTRYNDLTVTIPSNEAIGWKEDRRRVFSQLDIDANGRVPLDFIAQGANHVQESMRRALHRLLSATTETEMVTFKVNRQAQYVEPYEVILIADDDMENLLTSRIYQLSVDRKTIVLRDPLFFEVATSYSINVMVDNVLSTIPLDMVATGTGSRHKIVLQSALPADVPEFSSFSIGAPKAYRALDIDDSDTENDVYTISAIEINRDKYALVDNVAAGSPGASSFDFNTDAILPVTNLTATTRVRNTPLGVRQDIVIAFDRSGSALSRTYEIQVSFNGAASSVLDTVGTNSYTIEGASQGNYVFTVVALAIGDRRSKGVSVPLTLGAPSISIPAVTGLVTTNGDPATSGSFFGPNIELAWNLTPVVVWDGFSSGAPYPSFSQYRIRVFDGAVLKRTAFSFTSSFVYTQSMNSVDNAGEPKRTLTFTVDVQDTGGNFGTSASLVASNPAPVVGSVSVTPGIGMVFINAAAPPDTDFLGTIVWVKTISGFVPTTANFDHGGGQTFFALDEPQNQTFYVRVAFYDTFGLFGLAPTSEIAVTTDEIQPEKQFTFTGIVFTPNSPVTDSVAWTPGAVNFAPIGDVPVQKSITAGSAAWTSGVLYIYYVEGETILRTTTNISTAFASLGRVLATYSGGKLIVVGNGDAFIDGARVIAGTIGASQLVATQVITSQAQLGSAIVGTAQIQSAAVGDAQISNISAGKITAGTITAAVNVGSTAKVLIDGVNNRIVISD